MANRKELDDRWDEDEMVSILDVHLRSYPAVCVPLPVLGVLARKLIAEGYRKPDKEADGIAAYDLGLDQM